MLTPTLHGNNRSKHLARQSSRRNTEHIMAAIVDHAAIQAQSLPDLAAPEKGTLASKQPFLTPDKTTYADAKGLDGSFKLPDVGSLKFVKGDCPDASKPVAVLFWGKYAKGDYRTMVHFSYLMRALPELQVLGVSCDAVFEDCEAMLKKNNTPMPTQSIDELIFDMSLAFDEGKKVKDAFAKVGKAPAPGFAFLFDGSGTLVWKEVFTSSWNLKQGQFAEQCALLLAGKPLIDNGARPAESDDEDEEEAVVGDIDIPDLDAGDY